MQGREKQREDKKMKSLKWTGKNGKEIELRAECKIEMVDKIINADGVKIAVGKEEYNKAKLELLVDGKRVDFCNGDTNFWRIIDNNGVKQIWGLRKVGFDTERAMLVEKFLAEVIAEGKGEKVVEAEKEEERKEKAELAEKAESVLAKAAKQDKIMTTAEYREWRRAYSNATNEGGEGYAPELVTMEDVVWAKGILDRQ